MSLATLAVAYGSTLDQIASALGVRVELLENADRGYQALPLQLCTKIAILLSLELQQADVVHEVSKVTSNISPDALIPLPPRLGDVVRGVNITKTLPVVLP